MTSYFRTWVTIRARYIFDGATRNLAVNLSMGAKSLNEAVVIGYGTAKQKDLTGAIVTVKAGRF